MRILYGVVGEGMGHATRSRVVLRHLLEAGHTIKVVVSGRAHTFLRERFAQHPRLDLQEIHGLSLTLEGNAVDRSESFWRNLEAAPAGLARNLRAYREVASSGFEPDAVVSDFESWAYLYALNHFLPVVSLDNMQVLNRCRHPDELTERSSFQVAKAAVKLKLPGAYHYLVTSFFFPPVRKKRTTLVPPILRPEVLAATREPGEHVLVYQPAEALRALLPVLRRLPARFVAYGLGDGGVQGNVTLRPFSETGFIDDLRTARAVVAAGGFSLMSEAVHLGVPMLTVPLRKQAEQEVNAHYLQRLGYGVHARSLSAQVLADFLERTDACSEALRSYPRQDNSMTMGCLDEVLHHIKEDESAPVRLESAAMARY